MNDRHFFRYLFNPVFIASISVFIASISKGVLFGIPIHWMYVKCGAVRGAVIFIATRL